MTGHTIETFQTAGTLDTPNAPTWGAVARGADGTPLRINGETVRTRGHHSEQEAEKALTRRLTDHAA